MLVSRRGVVEVAWGKLAVEPEKLKIWQHNNKKCQTRKERGENYKKSKTNKEEDRRAHGLRAAWTNWKMIPGILCDKVKGEVYKTAVTSKGLSVR